MQENKLNWVEIRATVRGILTSLGGACSEREFMREYYEVEEKSFNIILTTIKVSFFDFFRTFLSDVVEVYVINNEVVLRKVPNSEQTSHMDHITVKKYSKNYHGRRVDYHRLIANYHQYMQQQLMLQRYNQQVQFQHFQRNVINQYNQMLSNFQMGFNGPSPAVNFFQSPAPAYGRNLNENRMPTAPKRTHPEEENCSSEQESSGIFKVPPVPKRLNAPKTSDIYDNLQRKKSMQLSEVPKRQKMESPAKCDQDTSKSSNVMGPPPIPPRNLSKIFANLSVSENEEKENPPEDPLNSSNPFKNPKLLKIINDSYLEDTFDSFESSDMNTTRFSDTNPFVEENNIEGVPVPALIGIKKKLEAEKRSPVLLRFRPRKKFEFICED